METDILIDDTIMTDEQAPPPSLEFINSYRRQGGMDVSFLCNPDNEDGNIRGYHTLELDDVEMRTLAEECNCEQMLIMLIAYPSPNSIFSRI